jgi:hypothetical protein
VQALRRIWIRQYHRESGEDGENVIRRQEREHGLPPGTDQLLSPYHLDARHAGKHGTGWGGYKHHATETVSDPAGDHPGTGQPEPPNLITGVQTTHAAVADVAMTGPARDSRAAARLAPCEHTVGSGYIPADLLAASAQPASR